MLNIEIAYGNAQKQRIYRFRLPENSTAREAVLAANIVADFPDAQIENAPLGVFGRAVADDYPLRDGDRVEIYRPLKADPKDARRQRVANKKT